jgi:hypothetical protein
MVTLLLALLTPASAHPLGSDAWSLRGGLSIAQGRAVALVVGEVPMSVVVADLRAQAADGPVTRAQVDAYTLRRQQELIAGSTVTIDGAPTALEWRAAPSSANGRAVDGFFVYAVVATVQLPEAPSVTVSLHSEAWREHDAVYAAEARVEAPHRLISHDAPAGWTPDPAARRLTVHAQRFAAPRAP